MKRYSKLWSLGISFLCFAISVRGEKELPPVVPGSQFVGFGEKSDQTVGVAVHGDVEHEGTYFLSREASLWDLLLRIGTGDGGAEFNPATSVIITIRDSNGNPQSQKLQFRGMSPEELKKIPIIEDALYFFPHRIL